MSTWIIISWVCVAILTGVNIFIFLKLKQASEQMMKMAFPNAKNMNEALGQMQKMTQGMGGKGGMPGGASRPVGRGPAGGFQMPAQKGGAGGNAGNMDQQLKAAMDMLANMQKGGGKR